MDEAGLAVLFGIITASPAYATPRVSRHRLVADAELNRVFFPRNPHRRNEQYTVGRNTRSERARDSS